MIAICRSNDSTSITGPFDSELVQLLPPSVRFICHNGAGYNNIDVEACTSTADVAILLMIGALRRITVPFLTVRQGQWVGQSFGLGHDPKGRVLGILGTGGIGHTVTTRARAFGMKIQYYNRNRLVPEEAGDAKYVSFDEMIRTSDVLSLNLASNLSTRHIISSPQFEMMKDGVVIINTARGPILDESALVAALKSGKVFAAGLDVFEEEPKIHPELLNDDRVVLLPHVGTDTWETQREMELLVLHNLRNVAQGRPLVTLVREQRG